MLNQSNMSAEVYYNRGLALCTKGILKRQSQTTKAIELKPKSLLMPITIAGLLMQDRGLGNILSGRDESLNRQSKTTIRR